MEVAAARPARAAAAFRSAMVMPAAVASMRGARVPVAPTATRIMMIVAAATVIVAVIAAMVVVVAEYSPQNCARNAKLRRCGRRLDNGGERQGKQCDEQSSTRGRTL